MENKKIVYFDTNVFISLREEKEKKNFDSLNKILKLKEKFDYVYSNAHIFDFQNDSKGECVKDFEVMEEIVDNNYIYYDFIRNLHILNNIKKPELPFESSLKFDEIITNPIFSYFEKYSNFLDINKELSSSGFLEAMEKAAKLNEFYIKNPKEYKHTRKEIKDILKDKDEALKLSENYFNNFYYNDNISSLIKYVLYYFLIDFIAENHLKDRNKKLRYRNILIDAMHSFLATHSDYFVTNDEVVKHKSKFIANKIVYDSEEYGKIEVKLFRDFEDRKILSLEEFLNDVSLM
ncbi:hypothetical protein [Brachyspira pilosicoli]|uniref:hypothetical protein n=1 Tax=Brachyspira pilosicoli TaxID=52584 RepID=UPI0012F6D971|nr:hypothetical protein [Brachyspira pilosicoli]